MCSESARSLGLFVELFDELFKVAGFAEVAVDRGKAHVGHLIEAGERIHDQLADQGGRNLAFPGGFQAPNDAVDDPLDPLHLHRPLAQGDGHGAQQFVAVEGLALAVGLDHGQLTQLDPLEGGEAGAAIGALAPPADRVVVFGRPRIFDLRVVVTAKRTTHSPSLPGPP